MLPLVAFQPDELFRRPRPAGLVIETGFPWTFTLDLNCGIEYLGVINDVGWHSAVDVPVEWAGLAVDGLLDVEPLMAEGPEPSLTAAAGGREVLYLPGPGGEPCG